MTTPLSAPEQYRKSFVLVLVLVVAGAFVAMIRDFLIALFLAAIFSALLYPIYTRVSRAIGGRPALSSALVLLIGALLVGVPLLGLLGVIAAEALAVSKTLAPWIKAQFGAEGGIAAQLPQWLPLREAIEPYQSQLAAKLGELAAAAGQFLMQSIGNLTQNTVTFALNLFIMLYAMFYFLMHGPELLRTLTHYFPLRPADREVMVARGLSVTRATLKSVLIIGLLQGLLVGIAFWAAGIQGPAFWGTIVVVLSAIPGLGAPLVWVPAALYLAVTGAPGAALGLTLWCALVVGSVDNLLRPRIVGQDTQMPDLLILLSTLGGLAWFGPAGLVAGPILAAMTVTALSVYHETFADLLAEPAPTRREGGTIRNGESADSEAAP